MVYKVTSFIFISFLTIIPLNVQAEPYGMGDMPRENFSVFIEPSISAVVDHSSYSIIANVYIGTGIPLDVLGKIGLGISYLFKPMKKIEPLSCYIANCRLSLFIDAGIGGHQAMFKAKNISSFTPSGGETYVTAREIDTLISSVVGQIEMRGEVLLSLSKVHVGPYAKLGYTRKTGNRQTIEFSNNISQSDKISYSSFTGDAIVFGTGITIIAYHLVTRFGYQGQFGVYNRGYESETNPRDSSSSPYSSKYLIHSVEFSIGYRFSVYSF